MSNAWNHLNQIAGLGPRPIGSPANQSAADTIRDTLLASGLEVEEQPSGTISNPPKSKPGATVQPTRVQAPRLFALCQACAGTATCG